MKARIKELWKEQAEAAKVEAAPCLRQAQRGRQVPANLRELGYGR